MRRDRPRGHAHTDTVRGRERWRAEDSPHRVPYGLEVMPGGRVEIEPCARVEVGDGRGLLVRRGGTLRALGAPGRPIYFGPVASPEGATEGGRWVGLTVAEGASPDSALAEVTLDGAGAPALELGPAAALRVGAAHGLSVRGVTIARWGGYGLALVGPGRVVWSGDLVLRDGAGAEGAASVDDLDAVASLPGLQWQGIRPLAGRGDVRLTARQRVVHADAQWRPLGARYRVRAGARVMVAATLTLEPRVEMAFEDESELVVGLDAPGALRAEGDLDGSPVRLGGVDPSAAEPRWRGLFFGPLTRRDATRLAGVILRGAGLRSRRAMQGCEASPAPPEPDAAMVTFDGVSARDLLRQVRFEVGPPRGYAVAQGGDIPGLPLDVADPSQGIDLTVAGVGCAQRWPTRAGRCPVTPRCH